MIRQCVGDDGFALNQRMNGIEMNGKMESVYKCTMYIYVPTLRTRQEPRVGLVPLIQSSLNLSTMFPPNLVHAAKGENELEQSTEKEKKGESVSGGTGYRINMPELNSG